MNKKLPSQPNDSTGAHYGKESYNSDSVNKKGNYHQAPKARQDGKTSKRGANSKDGIWTHDLSLPGEKCA